MHSNFLKTDQRYRSALDSNPQSAIRCCWGIVDHLWPVVFVASRITTSLFWQPLGQLNVLNQCWGQMVRELQIYLMNQEMDPLRMVSPQSLFPPFLFLQQATRPTMPVQRRTEKVTPAKWSKIYSKHTVKTIYEDRLLTDSLYEGTGQLASNSLRCFQEQQKM